MKNPTYPVLAILVLAGSQSSANAGPPNKPAVASRYTAVFTSTPWEGASVQIKLTFDNRTLSLNYPCKAGTVQDIRVNGLKAGIHTATVTLLNTDTKHSLVTVVGCYISTPGTEIKIISVGDHSFSDANPFYSLGLDVRTNSARGLADIDTLWGVDQNKIPDLPFGKDYYARFRIGDTCKIVFYVGPDATSYVVGQSPVLIPTQANPGNEDKIFSEVLIDSFRTETNNGKGVN